MTGNKGVRTDDYEGLVKFGRIVSTIGHIGFRGPIGPMPMQRVGVECAAGKLPPPGESPTGQRILSGLAGYGEVE